MSRAGRNAEQKKRGRGTRVFIVIIILLILLLGAGFFVKLYIDNNLRYTEAFVAGKGPMVTLYSYGLQEQKGDGGASEDRLSPAATIVRGSGIRLYKKAEEQDGEIYRRIKAETGAAESTAPKAEEQDGADDGYEEYYVKESNISETRDGCVLEKKMYVRTPVTIYSSEDGPAIAGFAPKASELAVEGYDRLETDGKVNKYRISFTADDESSIEGYVYGKYLVATRKAAKKNYNANGEYDKARKDNYYFDLYGGAAASLDYYPYERTGIEGNEFLTYARAMYINASAAVDPDEYISLIKKTDCNAVVIDIKDGPLAYKSGVAGELSPTSYKHAYASEEEFRKGVDAYRDAGVYLIGRIVTFNDPYYAADHPKDCIKYAGQSSWPTAYSRNVWEYNVRLAIEAVEKFGFNEIQFDYVRFPEASYEMSRSGKANFRNKYNEEKGQAIQNFCFYAADQLREHGAYISIDVFGESAYGYMTAYGQYWAGIANIADAISAMPYTDHTGGDGAWKEPYETMKTWAGRAAKQQKMLQDPAAARTWITGYDTPYWAPEVNYNAGKLKAQIRGLEDAGLDGGFIPWNVFSSLSKYKQYKSIWKEQ